MDTWTRGKRARVSILMGLIILLFASFVTFEWTQYYFGIVRIDDPELPYSRITKTLTSFLIFLLAISVGQDGIDDKDPRRLRWAFLGFFLGDLFFLMNELSTAFDMIGIFTFLLAHILIIIRNGYGLAAYYQTKTGLRDYIADILLAAFILSATGLLFTYTLYDHLVGSAMLYVIIAYAFFLDLSLWVGLTSLRVGYFPKPNALLIAIGTLCFFIGDYLVGFNLALEPSMQRVVTVFLTWIFYAPAITFLALSGYRWIWIEETKT